MGRLEERKKGYIGQIVSGEKLAEICNEVYKLQYVEPSGCTVEDLLLIELRDNKYALVCTEGVGWKQDDYNLINVPTNVGDWSIYNGHVDLSVAVIKTCLTGETQDIADYIRVFGDRLDTNCSIWQSRMLEPVSVM